MPGKDLGRASWSALGSMLRPGVAGAGSLNAVSGSEEEARGKAGIGAWIRAGAGDEVTGGALDLIFC